MGKGKVKAAQRKAASKTADEMLASEAEDDMTTNSTIGDHDSSTVGGETAGSPFPSLPTKGVDIDEAMEWLVEKRATTREKGLKALAAHFRSSLDSEDDLAVIEEHMETLTTNLLRFVKRPAAAREGKLSLELLSLLALYKGADDAELLEAFEKPLKALIVASGETDDAMKELRVTALSCLALVGFVCGGADAQDELWMYFEEVRSNPSILAAVAHSN